MKVIFTEIEDSDVKPEIPVVNEVWAIHYRGSLLTRKRLIDILKENRVSYSPGYKIPRKIYFQKGTAKAAIKLSYLPDHVKEECSVVRYTPEI